MSGRDARLVERTAHRNLSHSHFENELFKTNAILASDVIKQAIIFFNIPIIPFEEAPKKPRIERKKKKRTSIPLTHYTLYFPTILRERAEKIAKCQRRSLSAWVTLAVEEKLAREEVVAARRAKKRAA